MTAKEMLKGLGILLLATYIIVTMALIAIPDEPKPVATNQRQLAGDYMRFHIIRSKLHLNEETEVYNWPSRNAYYYENGKRRPFNLQAEK